MNPRRLLLLTRFEDVPQGRGRPALLGRTVSDLLSGRGFKVTAADPLDREVGLGDPSPSEPPAALAALLPFRPDFDLPVLRCLASRGTTLHNTPNALALFADPVAHLQALSEKGIPVHRAFYLRLPRDPAHEPPPLPGLLDIHLRDGSSKRLTVKDRGSLDGLLSMVWRGDRTAVYRPGIAREGVSRVAVVRGQALGTDPVDALACRAVDALGLDFAQAEIVLGPGDPSVLEVLPFLDASSLALAALGELFLTAVETLFP